jgi:hypothetical protein
MENPHPASVASTLPAVAGCAQYDVVQVVQNGSFVSNRYNYQFSQNSLDGDDIENRFPINELVYNSRDHNF